MKIAAISDTHGENFDAPACDVLIRAGDLMQRGTMQEFIQMMTWLRRLPAKRILYVPGNHDIIVAKEPTLCRQLMPKNATLLLDETVEIDGVRFHGSPWVLPMENWAFMKEDPEIREIYKRRMPEDIDVLITHGPAYLKFDGGGYGSVALLEALMCRYDRLKTHIFGHIHQDGGQKDGISYNVAAMDLSNRMQRGCEEFEL
jgi:3',5'-cyclic AMP phosphodiesterase CpdA